MSELSEELKKWNHHYLFIKISSTKESLAYENFEVDHFPTLRYYIGHLSLYV